ncbi:hypothetical protein D3C87_813300 [compost metagenome]
MRAQLGHGQRFDLALLGEIRHQSRLARLIFTRQQYGFLNTGQLIEAGFDFPEFDTHATDFHLIVVTPQVLDRAVRAPACEIAGAIHARIRQGVERVVEEALGAQVGTVQIAASDPGTANIQLAHDANRHRTLLFIEQIHRGISHRFADVQGIACLDASRGRNHGGFGRAVVVDHVELLIAAELAQAVATDQQCTQRRVFKVLAEGVFGDGCRQKTHVQWLRAPPLEQRIDVLGALVSRCQMQGRAGTQRRPDFPGHGVETEPGKA